MCVCVCVCVCVRDRDRDRERQRETEREIEGGAVAKESTPGRGECRVSSEYGSRATEGPQAAQRWVGYG